MSRKFLSPIKLAQGATNPSTGSSGELFFNTTDLKVYAHNGTAWLPSGGGVTNSDTAPTSPVAGDAWYKTTEGTLFIYHDGFWVEASSTIQNAEPNQIPAGAIMAWTSNLIPQSWLLCDGSAVSRATYASLFAAIGTTYGAGNGTTTFNLPNLKGKTVVGRDAADTNFDALNIPSVYVGAKTHTLITAEMPSHTHTQDSHTHTYSGSTNTTGAHTHSLSGSNGGSTNLGPSVTSNSNGDFGYLLNGGRANSAGDHSHTFSGTTSAQSVATNQNTGGGGAHNNLQPYIVLNYIIKHTVGETPADSQLATRVGAIETTTVRSVPLGGTGASTLTSGSYLKGAGTSAITAQSGIPAGDITSGTLGVARGGTGAATFTSGAYLKGAGASAITAQAGIPIADVSGTLPIAQGGTGAVTGSGLVPIIPTGGSYSSVSANGLISFTAGVRADGIFSANYDSYRIILNVSSASAGDYLYFRYTTGGSVNSAASYYNGSIFHQVTTVSSWSNGSTVQSYSGRVGYFLNDNATYAIFDIHGPYGTSYKTNAIYESKYYATNPTFVTGAVGFNATTSFDGIYFSGESGSGTPNGTMQVFGYRK